MPIRLHARCLGMHVEDSQLGGALAFIHGSRKPPAESGAMQVKAFATGPKPGSYARRDDTTMPPTMSTKAAAW